MLPELTGIERALTASRFIAEARHRPVGGDLVIVDDGFGWWLCASAVETGIGAGYATITVLTPSASFASRLPPEGNVQLMHRLRGAPVEIRVLTAAQSISSYLPHHPQRPVGHAGHAPGRHRRRRRGAAPARLDATGPARTTCRRDRRCPGAAPSPPCDLRRPRSGHPSHRRLSGFRMTCAMQKAHRRQSAEMDDVALRERNLWIVSRYIDAINRSDLDTQKELYAEDAVFEMPYAPEGFDRKIVGRDNIIAFLADGVDAHGRREPPRHTTRHLPLGARRGDRRVQQRHGDEADRRRVPQ